MNLARLKSQTRWRLRRAWCGLHGCTQDRHFPFCGRCGAYIYEGFIEIGKLQPIFCAVWRVHRWLRNLGPKTPLAHVYGCQCRACKRERRAQTRRFTRRSRGSHWWSETDGRRPRGEAGSLGLRWHPHMGLSSYRDGTGKLREFRVPDVADLLAWRNPDRPWLLEAWEPLPTKVPGPHLVRPWCCYLNTIIFYTRPHQTLPPRCYLSWSEYSKTERHANGNSVLVRLARPVIKSDSTGSLAEYGRVEHRIRSDVLVDFAGETFESYGGTVIWSRPQWWMRHRFRRVKPGERLQRGEVFNP